MKSKSIYHSCQYQKQLNSIGKDPNYDLITSNGIIRHFIVGLLIEAEAFRKVVIPLGNRIGQKGLKILLPVSYTNLGNGAGGINFPIGSLVYKCNSILSRGRKGSICTQLVAGLQSKLL